MGNGKAALDSNALIKVLNHQLDLYAINVIDIYVPIVAIGEMLYGVHKSTRPIENRARLESYLRNVIVLGCSMETADIYGRIKNELLRSGRPIPENDMWISATALEHNLPVVTNDKHLSYVPGLEIIRY